ncbi:hypothetical protein D3C84_935600 [compost metagenome]
MPQIICTYKASQVGRGICQRFTNTQYSAYDSDAANIISSPCPTPCCQSEDKSPAASNQASPANETRAPTSNVVVGRVLSTGKASSTVSSGMVARIRPMEVALTVCAAKYASDWYSDMPSNPSSHSLAR